MFDGFLGQLLQFSTASNCRWRQTSDSPRLLLSPIPLRVRHRTRCNIAMPISKQTVSILSPMFSRHSTSVGSPTYNDVDGSAPVNLTTIAFPTTTCQSTQATANNRNFLLDRTNLLSPSLTLSNPTAHKGTSRIFKGKTQGARETSEGGTR